jgi:hypothetical protein
MFERSEFLTLPIFVLHNWEPEGQWRLRRLSLHPFFGEAKKGCGCRATPRPVNREFGSNSNIYTPLGMLKDFDLDRLYAD